MKTIARIRTDFPEKFGIPRQSGLIKELKGTVIFEPDFRNDEALRGLEGFSYIWLLWKFEKDRETEGWSPTVRPPKLGGNKRMGVFATRSPNRPNPIGMSSVKLESVEKTEKYGTVLRVSGIDLKDGTEIYDIKPYLPYADSHPEAESGFAVTDRAETLKVDFPEEKLRLVAEDKREALIKVLSLDPRPGYSSDGEKTYGLTFAGYEIKFRADMNIIRVTEVKIL